jgi:CIC family chloride channel protein
LSRPGLPLETRYPTLGVSACDFSLGSAAQRVVAVDEAGRYAGIVLVPDAHLPGNTRNGHTVADFLRYKSTALTSDMNIKVAMSKFDETESEALAVVDGPRTLRVLGLLTESYALRRYSEELDRARQDLIGEVG